jgi:hypothetical protein
MEIIKSSVEYLGGQISELLPDTLAKKFVDRWYFGGAWWRGDFLATNLDFIFLYPAA